jgi:GT2 family glycosyltransferase/tetratricopeptide (TPR) repeat protein
MAKTDIICPCFNGIADSVEMFQSLKATTKDFRLIIIDGASTDGTPEFFESQGVEVVRLEKNKGFGGGINEGFKRIESQNVVILNNDVLLTPQWLDRLLYLKENLPVPVGMIGPVTNFVCCLLDSGMIEDLGPLEEWFPGGYEDNDYCIRAMNLGWRMFIARNVFVHHKGSKTLNREFGDGKIVFNPRIRYFEKHYPKDEQKIVALYRVKNNHALFEESLRRTSKIVDGIFVWDDNSSPSLQNLVNSFSKVERFQHSDLPFDEYRDRSMLLTWAKTSDYDWALVLDSDEWLEERVTYESLHDLIRVPDPIIRSFIFHESTFWFKDFCRTDGIWEGQCHDRLFRLNSNQELTRGTSKGFHCSTIPVLPMECKRVTALRVEHYGYVAPEIRQEKFDFYTEMDDEVNPALVGGADYSHLLDDGVIRVCRFHPDNHFTLNVLMREGEEIDGAQIFSELWGLPQQINVLAEAESEATKSLRKLFKANVYIDKDKLELSAKRNFLLDQTSERWAFFLDTDEKLESPMSLRTMMDLVPDGYLFYFKNFQKDGRITMSENVRFFQTGCGFRFSGRLHETIEESVKANSRIVNAPVMIQHFGYLKDEGFLGDKIEKYAEILFEELKKNPDDARTHFSLALHYVNEQEIEKAIEHLEKAIKLNPNFIEAKKELASFYLDKGRKLIGDVVQVLPGSHPLKTRLFDMFEKLEGMSEQRIVVGKGNRSPNNQKVPIQN